GASVQFTGTPNSGQSLSINGQSYTLLYSMSDVQSMNNNVFGSYALAKPLDASAITTWAPIGSDGCFNNCGLQGVFQGLGNTISNLTINLRSSDRVGLFSDIGGGSISNFGLIGGTVTGRNFVGNLVGTNRGYLANVYATGTVYGSENVGGLAGYS